MIIKELHEISFITCNCFREVIFLSAFIIASTLVTKESTTSFFTSSLEGMGTEPETPCLRSSSTYKKLLLNQIINKKKEV